MRRVPKQKPRCSWSTRCLQIAALGYAVLHPWLLMAFLFFCYGYSCCCCLRGTSLPHSLLYPEVFSSSSTEYAAECGAPLVCVFSTHCFVGNIERLCLSTQARNLLQEETGAFCMCAIVPTALCPSPPTGASQL
jgi:hypothetical protein